MSRAGPYPTVSAHSASRENSCCGCGLRIPTGCAYGSRAECDVCGRITCGAGVFASLHNKQGWDSGPCLIDRGGFYACRFCRCPSCTKSCAVHTTGCDCGCSWCSQTSVAISAHASASGNPYDAILQLQPIAETGPPATRSQFTRRLVTQHELLNNVAYEAKESMGVIRKVLGAYWAEVQGAVKSSHSVGLGFGTGVQVDWKNGHVSGGSFEITHHRFADSPSLSLYYNERQRDPN